MDIPSLRLVYVSRAEFSAIILSEACIEPTCLWIAHFLTLRKLPKVMFLFPCKARYHLLFAHRL